MTAPKITQKEFVERYLSRSEQEAHCSRGFILKNYVALRCACHDEECQGWAMVPNDPRIIETHNELYAPP